MKHLIVRIKNSKLLFSFLKDSTTSSHKTMLIYQVLNLIESEEELLKLYENVLQNDK